ncbi:hypothetical protein [Amycolatopsis pithecellobii]|uniref:Uncharacterized protein n=1 Tax=Amycolatopsis pithecellobii TaxID=664692 RepID=A0A6N7YUX1_9PSEU|nr:hypothetical protein [Amycolatopsis pithecellobii]MTD55718.1 hypothetical protein [Amycolatopsis pithecellobii]
MAISDEDWQRINAVKREAMLRNQEERRLVLERASKPTAAQVRRKQEEERLLQSRLRRLRDEKVKPIDLDNLG